MIANYFRYISVCSIFGILSFILFSDSTMADVYRFVDENQVIQLTNVADPKNKKEKNIESGSNSVLINSDSYDALIINTASKYNVDGDLIKAIIKVESNFNHKAVSKKGAKGLMQLMPQTALMLGVSDCFHPKNNIDGGIRYISYLISLYNGNLRLALAAYNAGEGNVAKHGGIPPYAETKSYVRMVMDNYKQYRKKSAEKAFASTSFSQDYHK
ncbi:MAG: lytic transglycosylase domain-containing protein [Smithella sp.]